MGFSSFEGFLQVNLLDDHSPTRKEIAPTVLILIDSVDLGTFLEHCRPVLYRLWRGAVYMLPVGSKIGRVGEVSSI